MVVLVTGGAGFIGSHLVDALLERGYEVRVADDLSSGSLENLKRHLGGRDLEILKGDLREPEVCERAVRDAELVFHFAANPEVRLSSTEPGVHFSENVVLTFNLLEACRREGSIEAFLFASSSTVYGDARVHPTPEAHELRPISVYGASKAACEALVCSYAHLYGFKSAALRYANIVGPRLRRGVIYDFLTKLKRNPRVLEVLGDGTQRKSYLYISDAIEATLLIAERLSSPFETYNVGNEDWITVREIAEVVCRVLGIEPEIVFSGGTPDGRGWPGDVKYMLLDIGKLEALGWRPEYSSSEAVEKTARALAAELWST